jgi:hypothetical protein
LLSYSPAGRNGARFAFAASLALALHVLFALVCFHSRKLERAAASAPAGTTLLVQLRLQAPAPRPARLAAPAGKPARVPLPQATTAAPPSRQAPAGPESIAPDAAPVPLAQGQDSGALAAQLRRDIGKIDRELRDGKPGVPLIRPDSPQLRLERALAGAYRGGPRGFTVDTYTSADGVIITRKTTSSGVACYMSGTVNFIPGILRSSEAPQRVNCPADAREWRRQ